MRLIDYIYSSILFWMAWIIIPLLMEILPAVIQFFMLLFYRNNKKEPENNYFPLITIIIPVYNSRDSLRACIASIVESNYPDEKIEVMLVNNEGEDDSFQVYMDCQKEFSTLKMIWMNSKQGKSKALNLALFNSKGEYIINIDSDGVLHPNAIRNMVYQFEHDKKTDCMTGTILSSTDMIEQTEGRWLRLLRKIEFVEYAQAFLAGRTFESAFNSIYTLSGAFSGFRRSTIMKTKLYHTDTVCEDTQITFQVRQELNRKVKVCSNAIFFVDPIEGMNKLYTQRQRWQRGEIEVAHLFLNRKKNRKRVSFQNFAVRLLIFDHTYAFPRMIWYFALLFLVFLNYPIKLVVISVVLIFLLYMMTSFLYYVNVSIYLTEYKELKKYYMRKWYAVLLLPFYNFIIFWFRFAGIINSIRGEQTWRTKNLTEEKAILKQIITKDFHAFCERMNKIKKRISVNENE
ncbi:glycosyltransferase [Lachnospiraceae bacterium KM106-2]|nr:glycosyltransferase [Lachnospiraceae bacterium KM106-2]